MALLPLHKYFIFNGNVKPNTEFVASENEGGIYEVLRIKNGIPLFLEEHVKRFFTSATIAKKPVRFSFNEIASFVQTLVSVNNNSEGNILISCKKNFKAFYIPHVYPLEQMYFNGIKCGILHAERENPNAKIFQTRVRQKANKLIASTGVYEVLLADCFERITEGSRSNVFFVKEMQIITPENKSVLQGITRQKTLELAHNSGFEIEEKNVPISDLKLFEAAFITGTSPKILPVQRIENFSFNPRNEVVRALMEGYNKLIDEYIQIHL
ncbi:MAG: aminotransferase class IV family protein [Prolixibacteraceae bacterium]|nr:aminotransferase class IV family protein [Prolixibacteraceae bacterium]